MFLLKRHLIKIQIISAEKQLNFIRKYMARSTGRKRFWFQQNKDEQQIIEQKETTKDN